MHTESLQQDSRVAQILSNVQALENFTAQVVFARNRYEVIHNSENEASYGSALENQRYTREAIAAGVADLVGAQAANDKPVLICVRFPGPTPAKDASAFLRTHNLTRINLLAMAANGSSPDSWPEVVYTLEVTAAQADAIEADRGIGCA
jgi:hypothetical protein